MFRLTSWLAIIACLYGCTNLANLREILNTVSYDSATFTYQLDAQTAQISFAVGNTQGKFRVYSAQLGFDSMALNSGVLDVTLATGSVDLANPLIEELLRGKDWFASNTHKLATFRSTEFAVASNAATIQGFLTIREISQPMTLQVNFPQGPPNLASDPAKISFVATSQFSRASFGMNALTEFAPDRVELEIQGHFIAYTAD
ncbi:MAG: YceI family protein [Pseudomonadota bacterium]